MNRDLATLLQSAVPLFQGVKKDHIRDVLSICKTRSFKEGEILLESGGSSDEMLLILWGAVLVMTPTGVPLAQLSTPETVGEMGIFTGEPRSATVEGSDDGTLVSIDRDDLLSLLDNHLEMAVQIHRNVVAILAIRLRNENFLIQMLRDQVDTLETRCLAPPKEEAPEVPEPALEQDEIIQDFYQSIGNPEVTAEQHERDLEVYQEMRQKGYGDAKILQAARWTATKVHGVKAFTLVKYCLDEALKG